MYNFAQGISVFSCFNRQSCKMSSNIGKLRNFIIAFLWPNQIWKNRRKKTNRRGKVQEIKNGLFLSIIASFVPDLNGHRWVGSKTYVPWFSILDHKKRDSHIADLHTVLLIVQLHNRIIKIVLKTLSHLLNCMIQFASFNQIYYILSPKHWSISWVQTLLMNKSTLICIFFVELINSFARQNKFTFWIF